MRYIALCLMALIVGCNEKSANEPTHTIVKRGNDVLRINNQTGQVFIRCAPGEDAFGIHTAGNICINGWGDEQAIMKIRQQRSTYEAAKASTADDARQKREREVALLEAQYDAANASKASQEQIELAKLNAVMAGYRQAQQAQAQRQDALLMYNAINGLSNQLQRTPQPQFYNTRCTNGLGSIDCQTYGY